MVEIAESAKLPISALLFAARTRHARLARLTRARRGGSEGGRRESSLLTFSALLVIQKREKKKSCFMILSGRRRRRSLQTKAQAQPTDKTRNQIFHPLFLLHIQAQKKKLSKRKRREGIDTYAKHVCRRRRDWVISRFAKRDHRCRWTTPPFKEKAGENFKITT